MKINKPFVLSDSSVNSYGFRLLTEGYQKKEFEKNPIGYYMHEREKGVLVRWEDIQIKGDQIIGYPNINEAHPRAAQTIEEINNGFLNAASVGHIIVLEQSDAPELRKPGQTGVTVTKWFNRECSLVDVPGNFNAYTFYNSKDEAINLSALTRIRIPVKVGILKNLYNLPYNLLSADTDVLKKIDVDRLLKTAIQNKDITPETAAELKKTYYDKADKLLPLLHEFAEMRIEYLMQLPWEELDGSDMMEELKTKYLFGFEWKAFLKFGNKKKGDKNYVDMNALIEWGVNNGNIPEGAEDFVKKCCNNDIDSLKERLNKYVKLRYDEYAGSSWDELDKKGLLETIKKDYSQLFKLKFKERFGIDYKEPSKK